MAEGWRMSMGQIVAVLLADDVLWLGRWRTLPGVEVCEAEQRIWVRGPAELDWMRMPAVARYVEDEAGRLLRPGERVPLRRLPEGQWTAVTALLRVCPVPAALPAQSGIPMAWRLVPAETFREPALLVLPFEKFASWCLTAPAPRLRLLRFALGRDGRACVNGSLLPPLPGESWCLEQSIATPAGWALPPGLTASLVMKSMNLASGELALVHPDASAERLPAEAFVNVTRGAIRASLPQRI